MRIGPAEARAAYRPGPQPVIVITGRGESIASNRERERTIGDWLEKLGMPEYGECFAQNKIDLSVLPHLTDQDLKDIGVPLGHRRKMLAAIRGLPGKSPIASKTVPTG